MMKKGKKIALILFMAVLSAWGEEDTAFDKDFASWETSSDRDVVRDTGNKVRGSSSIRIENGGTAVLPVELEPNTEYELTFYVKGKDIQSGTYKQGKQVKPYGGRIQLHDNKRWIRITTDPMKGKLETGTFDWRFGRRIIKSSTWKNKVVNIELAVRGKGTIWFDEVQLKKVRKINTASFRINYDNAIQSLALVPQGCFGFFEPGEKVEFSVLCKSHAKKLEYAYKVKDENGRQILSVPRKALETKFTIPGQPCGYYVVEADFFANGKKSRSLQSAFAVSRRIEKRDPFFRVGHGAHQSFYDAFKRIGVGSVCLKMSIPNKDETVDAQWKHHQKLYKRFFDGKDFELTLTTIVQRRKKMRTKEQIADGWPLLNDERIQVYLQYLDLLLSQFKGKTKQWQFQIELPTSASPKGIHEGTWSESMSNFMVVTRIGSRRVRKADPSIKILVGGNNLQRNTWTIEKIVMGDLVNDFDQYIIDAYTGQWDMTTGSSPIPEIGKMSFYQDASKLSQSLGKGKIIGNAESGYCISYASPFDRGLALTQAVYTARQLIITKAAPVSFFELHKLGLEPGNKEHKDSDRIMTTVWKPVWFNNKMYQVPLPGGAMYAAAAAQLAFVKNPIYFHEGNNYAAVFSKPDGNSLLVLWNIEKEFPFSFTFPAATRMVSMYGRESVIPAGKHTLNLTWAPIYLTLKQPPKELAKRVSDELKNQSPQIRCCGYEIDPGLVKVFVRNISSRTQSGSVLGRKISVPPQQTLSFEVKTSSGDLYFQSDSGRKYKIDLRKDHFVKIPYLAHKPVFDGSGKWLAGLKKRTLSYPNDIYPTSALQEELGYFKSARSNPNGHNVSADYWIAYDRDNFYLAVDVDDPIHIQRHEGANIWRDDCLQFVFDNREHHSPRELADLTEKLNRPAYNFAAALTRQGPELVNFSKGKFDASGCKANVVRKGKHTFYEI